MKRKPIAILIVLGLLTAILTLIILFPGAYLASRHAIEQTLNQHYQTANESMRDALQINLNELRATTPNQTRRYQSS